MITLHNDVAKTTPPRLKNKLRKILLKPTKYRPSLIKIIVS
jgi:hypothetical protein